MGKRYLNKYFIKEGIWILENILKINAKVIEEIQMKTTMRYYFLSTRMAIIKKCRQVYNIL